MLLSLKIWFVVYEDVRGLGVVVLMCGVDVVLTTISSVFVLKNVSEVIVSTVFHQTPKHVCILVYIWVWGAEVSIGWIWPRWFLQSFWLILGACFTFTLKKKNMNQVQTLIIPIGLWPIFNLWWCVYYTKLLSIVINMLVTKTRTLKSCLWCVKW